MSFASEIRRHFGKEDESGIKKLQEDIRKIYKDINDEKKSDCISDIEKVCKDLNEIYMDEDNENMVIETIRSLSFYQNLPWFREDFKRLLSFLEEDYYLRTDAMRNVLDSGWASNESYAFSEDDRGDAFIKKLLPDIVEEFYLDLPEDVLEDELLNLKRDAFIKRFFLGRYIFDSKLLSDCKFLECRYDQATQEAIVVFPERKDLKMHFLTAHKSKGLQADYVFIINNKERGMGFPSKIQDDPLVDCLLEGKEDFPYAEERRLFYVALTRAKVKSFLVVVNGNESLFASEMEQKYVDELKKEPFTCPWCGGYLEKKTGPYGEFYGCSNYRSTGCSFKRKILKTK